MTSARDVVRLAAAGAATAATALLVGGVPLDADVAPARLSAPPGAVVTVTAPDADGVHVVELRYGDRRRAVVLTDDAPRTAVVLPPQPSPAVLVARAEPAVGVELRDDPAATAEGTTWAPVAIPAELPPPQPAEAGTPLARAAVDSRDVWGVRPHGVPLRAAPRVAADEVMTAFHGDVLEATCWTVGQQIGDGYAGIREDTYRSAIWFLVRAWTGEDAYVPDTRFSRTRSAGRLGLPLCGLPTGR